MRVVARAFVFLFLALAGMWGIAELAARIYLHRAISTGWPVPSGNLHAVTDLYPPQAPNDVERRIAAVAWRMGIDLWPKHGPDRPPGLTMTSHAWDQASPAVRKYITAGMQGSLASPPPLVAAFLDQNRGNIQAIEAILAGGPPVSRIDVSQGYGEPGPHFLGHVELAQALTAAVMQRAAQGDTQGSWHLLRAMSRLPESLWHRPELLGPVLGIAEAKYVIGAMRLIHGAPPDWSATWPDTDLTAALAHTSMAEASMKGALPDKPADLAMALSGGHPSFKGRLISTLLSPYWRVSAGNVVVSERSVLQQMLRMTPCDRRFVSVTWREAVPLWNIPGSIAFVGNSVAGSFMRLHRLNAEIEGTRLLLAARRAREAGGSWPAEAPAIASPCSEGVWSYAVAPSGELHLKMILPLPKEVGGSKLAEEMVERE